MQNLNSNENIIIGFHAALNNLSNSSDLNPIIQGICNQHFNHQIITDELGNQQLIILANEYIIEQGGIFNATVNSLVNELQQESIYISNLQAHII